MTTGPIKEFVQFFSQFFDLCLSEWPGEATEPEEISRALQVAQHLELIVKKMKCERDRFEKFSVLLCINQNFTQTFLQNCMNDPPKCILKKILNSDAPVHILDIALERFRVLYSSDRLVECLSQLMLEAASNETLLNNMSTALPAHKVQEFNTHLNLFVILECESCQVVVDTLRNCSQQMMDAVVLCLVKDDIIGFKKDDLETIRTKIITAFSIAMICKDTSSRGFWKRLFDVDKENLVEMCLKYKGLGEMAIAALGDCYTQIINKTLHESCYIQFTEPQLYSKCKMMFESDSLKLEFMKYMKSNGYSEKYMPIL